MMEICLRMVLLLCILEMMEHMINPTKTHGWHVLQRMHSQMERISIICMTPLISLQ